MRLELFGPCGKIYAMLSMVMRQKSKIEVKFGRRNNG